MKFLPALVALVCSVAAAEVRVSFPFEGSYRIGRYMPALVQFDGDDAKLSITITGQGIVPITIDPRGTAGDLIIPMLVIAEPADLRIDSASGVERIERSFHPSPAGKLSAGNDPRMQSLVTAIPVAWEMLDELHIQNIEDIDPSTLACLIAAGTRISDASGRSLQAEIAGPRGALAGEKAYLPLVSWDAGVGAATRRRIVLAGIIFAILATGCAMLPSWRAAVAAGLLLTVVTSATFLLWTRAVPPMREGRGDILLEADGLVQRDRWTFVVARGDARGKIDLTDTLRPILIHQQQVRDLGLHLYVVNGSNPPSYHFRPKRGEALAFVSRTVVRGRAGDIAPEPINSPLVGLARALYEPDGVELQGQQHARSDDWPALVLHRP
jgi:hypothetical protein